MRLGRASAYGLYALIFVSRQRTDAPVQVHLIAESTGLPIEYLRKILQRMTRARLIQSERGRRGGFRMTRDPSSITLLDVVEAIEGPLDEQSVFEDGLLGTATGALARRLRKFRKDTSKNLRDLLIATRLSDLTAI